MATSTAVACSITARGFSGSLSGRPGTDGKKLSADRTSVGKLSGHEVLPDYGCGVQGVGRS